MTSFSERYTSPERLARELATVFRRAWLVAAHASELARPGDWTTLELGAASYLVSRGDDGRARAFHNVCVHRGTLLAHDRRGRGALRCPYHFWTYAPDGRLVGAPGAPLHGGLRPIACEERAGFVFVAAEPDEPLEAFLGPALERLEAQRPEGFTLVEERTYALDCNWKVSADVHDEGYHLPFLHPELAALVDLERVAWTRLGRHGSFHVPMGVPTSGPHAGRVEPLLAAWAQGLGVARADLAPDRLDAAVERAIRARAAAGGVALPAADRLRDKVQLALFPNVQLNFGPFDLEIYRHRPHASDPHRCHFDEQRLARQPAGAPAPRVVTQRGDPARLSPSSALAQDLAIAPRLQRGLATGALEEPRLARHEEPIALLHEQIDAYLGGPP